MNSTIFKFDRLVNYILRYWVYNHKSLYSGAGVLLAIVGIMCFIQLKYIGIAEEGQSIYFLVMYIGGLLYSSRIFSEFQKKGKNYAPLTLPVSTLEKVIGAWLISAVAFLLFYFSITTVLFLSINFLLKSEISFGPLWNKETHIGLAEYLVYHSLFFLGAIYFSKSNFLRSLLFIIGFLILLGIFSGGLILTQAIEALNNPSSSGTTEFNNNTLFNKIRTILFWILGPVCLVLTYFQLKNKQV